MQYIEEPTSCWEDSLVFYQETGVPIALDETLDHAMRRRQVGYWYKGVDSHVFCPAAACTLKSWVLAYQSTWRI